MRTSEHRILGPKPSVFSMVMALILGAFTVLTLVAQAPTSSPDAWRACGLECVPPVQEWFGDIPELGFLRLLAGMSAVAAVLIGPRRLALALTLAVWPLLMIPWSGQFLWAGWLAVVIVAAEAVRYSWRRAVIPASVATLWAAGYCFSNIPALLPIGLVTAAGSTWNGPGTAIIWFEHPGRAGISLVFYLAVIAGVLVVTRLLSQQSRRATESEARARAAQQAEGAATERARLARDLHDVVAHHISLIAVRAESARFATPDLSPSAQATLADIGDDARSALTELRHILAVLRAADESAPLVPQQGSNDVPQLVEAARSAGQDIDQIGELPTLPPAIGGVAYRSVQEALTNARRHAPGQRVTLTMTESAEHVTLIMANPASGSTVTPGRGLAGMRERVEAIQGHCEYTITGGMFRVSITLPYDLS